MYSYAEIALSAKIPLKASNSNSKDTKKNDETNQSEPQILMVVFVSV